MAWRRMDMITTRIHALHAANAANAQDLDAAGHVVTIRREELDPALRERFTSVFGPSDVSVTLFLLRRTRPSEGVGYSKINMFYNT